MIAALSLRNFSLSYIFYTSINIIKKIAEYKNPRE